MRMYQPKQAGKQDIAKFLVRSPLRIGKGQVHQLPHRTADRDSTLREMINYTEPVLVIYGSEIPVEVLWIDQERAARNE